MALLGIAAIGGLALGAGGTAYSIYENEQAKDEAKKQREEEKIASAWQALIQAAAGTPVSIDTNLTPIPKSNVGSSIANLGQDIINTAGTLASQNRQNAELDYKKQQDALSTLATVNPNYGTSVSQQTPNQLGAPVTTIEPTSSGPLLSNYGTGVDPILQNSSGGQIPGVSLGNDVPYYLMSPEETIKRASAVTPEMQGNAAYQQALGKEQQGLAVKSATQDAAVENAVSYEMKKLGLNPSSETDRQVYYDLKRKSGQSPVVNVLNQSLDSLYSR